MFCELFRQTLHKGNGLDDMNAVTGRTGSFFISSHGMTDEHEFFAELKTDKALVNRSYPDYIEEILREFLL